MIMIFCFMILTIQMKSQVAYRTAPPPGKITRLEYFIDTDPGLGQAINVPLNPSEKVENQQIPISLEEVNNGIHFLYFRSLNEQGNWSLNNSFLFNNFLLPDYSSSGSRPAINAAEYFIDADPGAGKGIPIPLNPDTANQSSFLVDLTELNPGVHQLYVRTKDETGKWSLSNFSLFNNSSVVPYRSAPAPSSPIKALEYFMDTDPGFGMGSKILVPSTSDIASLNVDVDISDLNEGNHVLYFRSLENPWSLSAYTTLQIGSVLPVTWLYVNAVASPGGSLIRWATSAEINSAKFTIQYSMDGSRFIDAGEIPSRNQTGGSTYTYNHSVERSGLYYYRIRQTDKDGKFTFSRVVQLYVNKLNEKPRVYPNPAREVVFVDLEIDRTVKQVCLLDQQGKLLRIVKGAALNERPLGLFIGDLPDGAYYIKVYNDDAAIIYPVMKN
jgi:hypothetical protein